MRLVDVLTGDVVFGVEMAGRFLFRDGEKRASEQPSGAWLVRSDRLATRAMAAAVVRRYYRREDGEQWP